MPDVTFSSAGAPPAAKPGPAVPGGVLLAGATALAGVGLVVAGIVRSAEPWAAVAVAAGVFVILSAVLAWLAGRPAVGAGVAAAEIAAATAVAGLVTGSASAGLAGVMGLVVVAAAASVAGTVAGRLDTLVAAAGGGGPARDTAGGLPPEALEMLRRIDEHAMLSDNARRVLFRQRELALLDQAIEDDIRDGRFDVALTLCEEVADVFGERERAEAYRERVLRDRRQREDAVLGHGFAELDRRLAERQWQAARAAAERLRQTHADPQVAEEVERRFAAARDAHKAELEREFLAAAQRGDVEDAMRRLKEMDHYLTPHEAEQFRELAGGVIKKHRENLGVQFKMAVNDHRWTEAVEVGSTIMNEFPNTRMAAEVRSMIDLLRGRAGEAESATPSGTEAAASVAMPSAPARPGAPATENDPASGASA